MSVANQEKIIINKSKTNKDNIYLCANLDALQEAMINLKNNSALKLWLFFVKNQNGYQFELSQVEANKWGISKSSYYRGKKELEEKGYLVPVKEGSNIFTFFDKPQFQNETTAQERSSGEFQNETEKFQNETGEFQNETEKFQNEQRNIKDNKLKIKDNKMKNFGGEGKIDWVAENRKIMIKLQDMYETTTQPEVKEKIEEVETILRTEFTKEEINGECAEEIYFLFLEYFPNITTTSANAETKKSLEEWDKENKQIIRNIYNNLGELPAIRFKNELFEIRKEFTDYEWNYECAEEIYFILMELKEKYCA